MSPTSRHPSYPNPTIDEALCELHFELPEDRPWDRSWFGDFLKLAGDEYPRMEPTEFAEVGLNVASDGTAVGVRRPKLRCRYEHVERPHLFQLSDAVFTINELRPYAGWQRFVDDIRRGWELMSSTVAPTNLSRIGLRYINQIPRGSATEPISKWIASNDYLPSRLLTARDRFHTRTQIPVADDTRLVVTIADLVAADGSPSIVLDIDVILTRNVQPVTAAIEAEANKLHDIVWSVFDACSTPAMRALLEGKNEDVRAH